MVLGIPNLHRNVNTETKDSSSKLEKDAQKAENPHCSFINYGMEISEYLVKSSVSGKKQNRWTITGKIEF